MLPFVSIIPFFILKVSLLRIIQLIEPAMGTGNLVGVPAEWPEPRLQVVQILGNTLIL